MSLATAWPHSSFGLTGKPGKRCLMRHYQNPEAVTGRVAARRRARRGSSAAADIQKPTVPIQTHLVHQDGLELW